MWHGLPAHGVSPIFVMAKMAMTPPQDFIGHGLNVVVFQEQIYIIGGIGPHEQTPARILMGELLLRAKYTGHQGMNDVFYAP